jgi:thymidylate synthase (FAD)
MKAIYQGHYLDDMAVANAARLSFDKLAANFTPEQNHNLIRFLARGMQSKDWESLIDDLLHLKEDHTAEEAKKKAHELATYCRSIPEHWVPFGHPHISILMEAPVPIARQLFKHKIGFVESEESRRYIKSTPQLYIPDEFRAAAANVKQGSAGVHERSEHWKEHYIDLCTTAIARYEHMIADGVAPEQARFILPQGCEVHWLWTGSLYAFANMYNQRADSHAQKESQTLAGEIDAIIAPLYPVSWAALTRGAY